MKNIQFINEFWSIIPARSGSKSIKNKNIKKLNGEPLLIHSLRFSKKIKKIKKTILSSDSKKYLSIAKKIKNIILHKRSLSASKDNSSDLSVMLDFIQSHLKNNNFLPKYFIYFRPTTPIRNIKTANKAINKFKKISTKYTSLSSINEMSETSFKSVIIKKKKLVGAFKKENLDYLNLPRQKFPKTYRFNGIIDIFLSQNILSKQFYGNKVYPFDTKEDCNIEIDNLNDFNKAKRYFLN